MATSASLPPSHSVGSSLQPGVTASTSQTAPSSAALTSTATAEQESTVAALPEDTPLPPLGGHHAEITKRDDRYSDKLLDSIVLVTGIIAAVASCTVLIGALIQWLHSRRLGCRHHHCPPGGVEEQRMSQQTVWNRQSWGFGAAPTPSIRHHIQPQQQGQLFFQAELSSDTGSIRNHRTSEISPIETEPAPLQGYQPSPVEPTVSPIRRPPASYHWQQPVELPTTADPGNTPLPPYLATMPSVIRPGRFSWINGEEAGYRPSEKMLQ
ncbi:hypothetical protein QQS21_010072 [Conoideocrella luteorostrata]|uniref:Uncharacterized protein n=1 Tax=Conoideocrella luteorostrata TaxID=1105319 RepID=A0AAJ0CFQ8_9HYPO|nr:hypothetical protein QQS21_010072 [Conoideocrella luteorostrata]